MNLRDRVYEHIKPRFEGDASGHDIHHIDRVLNHACFLQKHEGGDLEVIELAAVLHDISDHKFNGGQLNAGGKAAHELLMEFGCDPELADRVSEIIDQVSFKGAGTKSRVNSVEAMIVQDADRLDAIGAIGIARTFAYGGNKLQAIYDPELKPTMHTSFEEYVNSKSSTINHFYEKLLLLTERLNTETAKKIGRKRHAFMESFLEHFYEEWNFNRG